MQHPIHEPVLLDQVVELLAPRQGDRYLDLTAGYGGHAAKIAALTRGPLTLVDRDELSIKTLRTKFPEARIIHSDYESALEQLERADERFELVVIDLGVSSPQFDMPERGFSLQRSGPLDMRMDQRQALTAADIVNTYRESDLADLIYQYGEERASRRVAKAIVAARPLATTAELAEVVAKAFPKYSHIHPATRTFQALRIAVNDELGQLERSLPKIAELLAPNGRLAIISFHSLEDRIVKRFIKERADLENLTKKVIQGKIYDVTNPRARSAKLRAALKTKTS